jgi:hypothetical protein
MNRISKCMLAAAVLAVAADGLAQDQMQSPAIHANHGQSSAQQSRDADRCMVLARKRSGVDPTVLAANSTPLQEGKGWTSTPIDQPTMAMGSSGAGGTTGAGTGDMGAGQQGQMGAGQQGQMGSSGAGATGSSGGQMGTSEAGAMGSSGTGGTGATGSSSMGAQSGSGAAGSSGAMGSTGSSGAMASSDTSGSASGNAAMGASGSSGSTGTTGAGHPAGKSRGKLAMATADDYHNAFAKCMSSRGYTVETSSSGGN